MRKLILIAALAGLAALAWLYAPDWREDEIAGDPLSPATPEKIETGRYLTIAGNCLGCHTTADGAPYSGGRRIPTPYGNIYSSNLTPDTETGLGQWTAGEFYRALHHGRSRDGRLLYPAFPYTNYTRVSRQDSDAIFAYLQTLPAINQAQQPANLRFPYNTQLALRVWRAMYFQPENHVTTPEQSAQWNRGAYLVEGLGHCNACHTTRGWLGAKDEAAAYAGGPIPMLGWDAMPLASESPMSDADAAEMVTLLHAGTSEYNVTTGPMAEVVAQSLQHLSRSDIEAMVSYIRKLPASKAPTTTPELPVSQTRANKLFAQGKALYAQHCANCHGEDGRGEAFKYPALAGNRLVTSASTNNVMRSVLFGGFAPSTQGNPRPYGMPPFRPQLSDEELAAVLSFIRASWGNNAAPVSPAQISRF